MKLFFLSLPLFFLAAACATSQTQVETKATLKPDQRGLASMAVNPFGMGAAYIVGFSGQNPTDPKVAAALAQAREMQLQQTLYLAGPNGSVRIWCSTQEAWMSECQAAISRTYVLNLNPTINTFFQPSAQTGNDPSLASPQINFSKAASAFANWVARLPTVSGHFLSIEITNEPNFTDWWFSGVVDYQIRAKEVAEFVAQTADAIHALGNAQIKVSMGALSPVSDSNPPNDPAQASKCLKNAAGHCQRGNRLDLPAAKFIAAMLQERPDLFGMNPKVDFWAAHPYSTEHFNSAAGSCHLDTCPPPDQDPLLSEYQIDLKVAGLPADFPIQLTELGYGVKTNAIPNGYSLQSARQFAADFICSAGGTGAYPEIWLKGGPYNNVTATMGFVLPFSPTNDLNWLDSSIAPVAAVPFYTPLPIYNQVRSYRIKLGY